MHQGGAEIIDLAALRRAEPREFEARLCELFDLQLRGLVRTRERMPAGVTGERRIAAL